MHPERMTKVDKKRVNSLDYADIKFPVCKKDNDKIEKKNKFCINVFSYENDLIYLVHMSDQKLEKCMDLLLVTDENKSHYVYIKDFKRFMCNKTKSKIIDIVYNVLTVKKSCKNIKKVC